MAKDNIERLDTPDTTTTAVAKKKKPKGSNRISRWFREMKSELKKIVWPGPKQIVNHTSVVLTVMVIAGIAIWALDFASSQIFQAIITYIPRLING